LMKKNKTVKQKKCKVCKALYTPFNTLEKWCSIDCAIELTGIIKKKKLDKVHRNAKRKLKDEDRSFQVKKTQALFNRFIRMDDISDPCISCGRHHTGQYHAGHYRSIGSCRELRFNEDNCHKQCSACNNYLSGNLVNYRINLINKVGLEKVQWLEGPHKAQNYTIEDLKELQQVYKRKIKELEE